MPVLPSPKSHAYISGSPAGSDEPVPSKPTGEFTIPEYAPPASAVGVVTPGIATTVIVSESLKGGSPLSVTRTVITYVPPCPSDGVHRKLPVLQFIVAPGGAPTSSE